MSNNTIWIEKFKISEALKAEFENSDQKTKTSFLGWCLENGHVNESEYLAWASEHYQLPVVRSDFFSNEETKRQWRATWVTAKFLYQWNTTLLPLEDWLGVVRVGCLEVPDLKIDRPIAYVLAPMSGMKALWQDAFGAASVKVTAPVIVTPPPVVAEAPPLVASAPIITPPPIEIPSVPPPPPQEFDAGAMMANWGAPAEEHAADVPPPLPEDSQVAMPEGFNFSASDIPIPEVSPLEIPPVVAVAPTPTEPPPLIETTPTEPVVPPVAASTPTFAVARASVDLALAKPKFEECTNEIEVAATAFARAAKFFDKHLIFLTRGEELHPHLWAGTWTLRSEKPATVKLESPSFFRVAATTRLPYHGYTKPSAVNDGFFGEWTNGATPAHVTLIPLLYKNDLIGMVMGATDAQIESKIVLGEMERLAHELAQALHRICTSASQAA